MIGRAMTLILRFPYTRRRLACLLVSGYFAFSSTFVWAQQNKPSATETQEIKNPLAVDPKAIQEGASQFRIDCALCHGLGARGGSRGPDLTRGVWTHGGSDEQIFHTITQGVPGTLMPANDLSEAETWEIIAYLRSQSSSTPEAVSGDRNAGEKFFFGNGNCSLCHMVNGKGGRLGPDLSRVGAARSPGYLAEKLRQPDKNLAAGLFDPGREWPLEYEAVTVTTTEGQTITGVLRNEDTYSIQLMDSAEELHLLLKKDLQKVTHEHKSLMPRYGEDLLDEKELQNLIAYLDNLRGTAQEKTFK